MDAMVKALAIGGGVLLLTAAVLLLASKLGLGRLPGDFYTERGNVRIFAPLATSLVLSVVLTVALNIIFRLTR